MPSYNVNLLLIYIIYIQDKYIYIVFGYSAKQRQRGKRGEEDTFKWYNELALSLRSRELEVYIGSGAAKFGKLAQQHRDAEFFQGGGREMESVKPRV